MSARELFLTAWGLTDGTPEAEEAWQAKCAFEGGSAAYIVSDIGEYVSPIDGTAITSRSVHRGYLKTHDLVELGNERLKAPRPDLNVGSMRQEVRAHINQVRGMSNSEYQNYQNHQRERVN